MSGQPEALRLADEYEYEGFIGKHQFAREEWCRKAALELRRLHAENASLSTGYDAARLEIESLKANAQEQEELLAAVGAGGVEPLRKAGDYVRLSDVIARLEQACGAGSVPVTTLQYHFPGAAKMVQDGVAE